MHGLDRKSVLMSLLAGASLLGGCASGNDLIAAGRVAVEPHIAQTMRKPPEVYEDKGDLVIAGRLERSLQRDLAGHIDVAVIGPDGAMVYDAKVNYNGVTTYNKEWSGPKHAVFRQVRTRRYGSYWAYSVRFPGLPPEGSVVKVRHEPGPNVSAAPSPPLTPQP
ncbi:MAG: hypothetical protein AB7G17_13265 [Phycisphaerales bacterium]